MAYKATRHVMHTSDLFRMTFEHPNYPAMYSKNMSSTGNGFALYRPNPPSYLVSAVSREPEPRDTGVRIGALGFVNKEGSFEIAGRFSDEQIRQWGSVFVNPNHIPPSSSSPLGAFTCKQVRTAPRVDADTRTVTHHQPLSAGFELRIESAFVEGALLVLPHGGHLERLEALRNARDFLVDSSQYDLLVDMLTTHERRHCAPSLSVVTGHVKCADWATAALHKTSQQSNGLVAFEVLDSNSSLGYARSRYRWQDHGFTHSAFMTGEAGDGLSKRNCAFVQGFRVTKRLSAGPQRHKEKAKRLRSKFCEGLFISHSPALKETTIPHPLDMLNEHILANYPLALIAITHDTDLEALIKHDAGLFTQLKAGTLTHVDFCKVFEVKMVADTNLAYVSQVQAQILHREFP